MSAACPVRSERQLLLVRTCAARLHGHHDIGRLLYRGETRSHIRDEGRLSIALALPVSEADATTYPALLFALRKRLLDAVHGVE